MDFEHIREEISHSLRNGDILSISVRGVTTATETFTATASQTIFNLAQTGIKNIRSLTVQSVNKYLFRDYTYNAATGVVTLNTGATVGDSVVIQYDYSSSADKIYPDMPRTDLRLTSFPRVGIEITNSNTEPLGLGGMTHISDLLITVYAWVPVNKDTEIAGGLGGTSDLNDLIKNIRDIIRTNAKSYYNFTYITPKSTSPIIRGENNKIIQMSQDFYIKFLTEAT
jgi:hypothetical protein